MRALRAGPSTVAASSASSMSVGARETSAEPAGKPEIKPLWMVEQNAIERAIAYCDGNIPRAAALLEVAPSTIYRKKQSWEAMES
jgi:two-component system repressor protein LuxO